MGGRTTQSIGRYIKQYLVSPPVLVPPQTGKPFKLYLSADERAIGSALVQEFEGKERVIIMSVEDFWTPKQGILQCNVCAYAFTSHVPNSGTICYRRNVWSCAKTTW